MLTMLTRSISMANMEKREIIKSRLHDSIEDGENMHVISTTMTRKLNFMICFFLLDEEFRNYLRKNLLDDVMLRHLEEAKALNCFRNVKNLYPLQTPGSYLS